MEKALHILYILMATAAIVISSTPIARATLGQPAESVETDRHALSAQHTATTLNKGYTVREIASPTTTVREYISPSGIVFAIAWNGITYPDLEPLLGTYHEQYQKAMKKSGPNRGKRRLQVSTDKIVVQKWGHVRNLQGRAYAPALIPPGVSIDEIR